MATIASKWFGEGEKFVKAIFTLASKIAPTIIFIDEVDRFDCVYLIDLWSILGKRDRPGEHEAMRKIKNEFMTNWDGLKSKDNERVIVLAATNRPFDLDEAVLRRLSRRLLVDLPSTDNRIKILKVVSCSLFDGILLHLLDTGQRRFRGELWFRESCCPDRRLLWEWLKEPQYCRSLPAYSRDSPKRGTFDFKDYHWMLEERRRSTNQERRRTIRTPHQRHHSPSDFGGLWKVSQRDKRKCFRRCLLDSWTAEVEWDVWWRGQSEEGCTELFYVI